MSVTARRTLVFVPTYNERDNVRPMCEQILAHVPGATILFMDDGSPDGTGEILDRLAEEQPSVSVVHRTQKLGVGGAHLEGIALAYERGYERLVTIDCDFTHSPSDIPRLLAKSDEADIVVGSRWLDPDSLDGWSVIRRILTGTGHFLTVNALGVRGDATSGFRVYRLPTIPREMFELVKARGYAFFFESLFVAQRNGLSVIDVPIRLPTRTYGSSKMSMREIQRSVQQLASLYVADKVAPARFQLGKPLPDLDRKLIDQQGWDEYWEKKRTKGTLAYDVVATAYRNLIIKRHLNEAIRREFEPGSHLLHAGCGSGQVDVDLHDKVNITAVDISVPALEIYCKENPKAFAVKHASVFDLPLPDASFDGAYNLGVIEHFSPDEIIQMLGGLKRVLKPGGKLLIFWPHARASSVMVLNSIHWGLNSVLKKDVRLHPHEVSLVHSEREARDLLDAGGFDLRSYSFGPKDLFVQAVVVAQRR